MRVGFVVLLVLTLGGCAAGVTSTGPRPLAASELRDLTDAEKRVIAASVQRGSSLGQFRWAQFPKEAPPDGVVQYCGMVGGKRFITAVTMSSGRATSAQLGALGGGEGGYVDLECRRHYTTPFS
jgi:hypothetical protein